MRQYELTSNYGMTYMSVFGSRQERERFVRILRKWKSDEDKTEIIREMLFEDLANLHVMQQRLLDNRLFFSGEKTDYTLEMKIRDDGHGTTKEKVGVISAADQDRKEKELTKHLPVIAKIKCDIAKILLSKDISYHVHEGKDVQSLFDSLDRRGTIGASGTIGANGKDQT